MSQHKQRNDKLEGILQAFIALDKYFNKADSFADYLCFVHQTLAKLMYAKNLYLALYDPLDDTIKFAYDVDERDDKADPDRKFPLASPEQSPTAWVIKHGKTIVFWLIRQTM